MRSPRFLLVLLVALLGWGAAHADSWRFGVLAGPSGVAGVHADYLFLDVPTPDALPARFGLRADLTAPLGDPGLISPALTALLVVPPRDGVGAHLGFGASLARGRAPVRSAFPTVHGLVGIDAPLLPFVELTLEGTVNATLNAAGVSAGLTFIPGRIR